MLTLFVALLVAAATSRAAEGQTAPSADAKDWHLMEPIWASPVVYGESLLFLQTDEKLPADARLVLNPKRILRVASADGSKQFDESDYTLDSATGRFTLTPKSRIPFLKEAELYPPKGSPRSIKGKAGDPKHDLLWDETGWFHDRQVQVTYEPAEKWDGWRPTLVKDKLPRTFGKLERGEPLSIVLVGDSISTGDNASGTTNKEPHQPGFPDLVAGQLGKSYRSKITLQNRAVGGTRLENGLKDLPNLVEAKPDLVIIGFGMNHMRTGKPQQFKKMLAEEIEGIRAANKDVEFLLIASMLGNPDRREYTRDQFVAHRDVVQSLAGPGIAVCNMTDIWSKLLERKRYLDLTGNGINHPNDFGHRLYASAILGMLVEMPETAQK